jgi:hypothetical protein
MKLPVRHAADEDRYLPIVVKNPQLGLWPKIGSVVA